MVDYILTEAARGDLFGIFLFTFERFGESQALSYREALAARLDLLAREPDSCQRVRGDGLRRCVFRAHSIYYLPESGRVVIVRVLGRQDPAGLVGGAAG